jgi:hypothetical protein
MQLRRQIHEQQNVNVFEAVNRFVVNSRLTNSRAAYTESRHLTEREVRLHRHARIRSFGEDASVSTSKASRIAAVKIFSLGADWC